MREGSHEIREAGIVGMKIVIAVHHFPPTYTGGAEWRAYRTASALQSRGHEVRVLCIERLDMSLAEGDRLSWEDGVYEQIQVRRLFFDQEKAPDPHRYEYDNPWIGEHIQQFLQIHSPDIFHLISGYKLTGSALRSSMLLGIPTVVTLTDFWFMCPRFTMLRSNGELSTPPINAATCARCVAEEQRRFSLPSRILPPGLVDLYWRAQKGRIDQAQARIDFLRETLLHVDAIISPSQFLESMFVQAGFAGDQIVFSRQGRDFPHLDPNLLEKKAASSLRVGYLGQIAPIKGVQVFFEAIRLMKNAPIRARVYGDMTPFPDYTEQLQAMADEDNRMSLEGRFTSAELSSVFSELDVIVVPSEWYENSPNVILEAFAHRTPVLASNLGGMAELVQDGVNGLLFEPGNANSLAQQLSRLLEEPGLLNALQDGIEPVKSVRAEIDELEQIYHGILEKRSLSEEVVLK
jgi:glycosyltransferase involved in cell wall biosynthesis